MEHELNLSYIKNDLGFRYKLFDEFDLEYNLDYIDSNGHRYIQRLSEIEYGSSDVPNLLSASMDYVPSDQRQQSTDAFVGIVTSKIPEIGKRTHHDIQTITQLLSKHLESLILIDCVIHTTTDRLYVHDTNAGSLIEIDLRIHTDNTLYLGLLMPTEHSNNNEERFDDVRLAADIWALLHDFSANLSIHLGLHSSALGNFGFNDENPHQTLHIGVPRATDCCRFGMALLGAMTELEELDSMHAYGSLSEDIDYEKWDNKLAECSDDELRNISLRAVTLGKLTQIDNKSILSSMLMSADLQNLDTGEY